MLSWSSPQKVDRRRKHSIMSLGREMMTEKRKRYTREFKLEVLHLAENADKPIAHLERDLGLSVGTIHHWRREVLVDGEDAFPGSGRVTGQAEVIRRLKRENEVLREERDILKKAIIVFSQDKGQSTSSSRRAEGSSR
jgi:transposase